ncbi:MAG: hypothetical protein AB7F43_13880 [Bacteriovoracia bacterium]
MKTKLKALVICVGLIWSFGALADAGCPEGKTKLTNKTVETVMELGGVVSVVFAEDLVVPAFENEIILYKNEEDLTTIRLGVNKKNTGSALTVKAGKARLLTISREGYLGFEGGYLYSTDYSGSINYLAQWPIEILLRYIGDKVAFCITNIPPEEISYEQQEDTL